MKTVKNIKNLNIHLLADYTLYNYGPMSHLKLQKLLYYCEAYHLAYFGTPLLKEEFEAWVHGPVSPSLYHSLKSKSVLHSDLAYEGKGGVNSKIQKELTSSQLDLITEVLEDLSRWNSLELEAATHSESPWMEARKGYAEGDICNEIISKKSMLDFYKQELYEQV